MHPSVEKFKLFTKSHPLILKEVRSGKKTLQDFFEEWYILGEDDPSWIKYEAEGDNKKKVENGNGEGGWMTQLGSVLQKLDVEQVQGHLQNLSAAIAAVQNLIMQFQAPAQGGKSPQPVQQKNPFSFRKD